MNNSQNVNKLSLRIYGKSILEGTVQLSGYKHSSVLLVSAALLCQGSSILRNLPDMPDVGLLIECVKSLGCRVTRKAELTEIDANILTTERFSNQYATSIHGSIYLLPVLVARLGVAKMFLPGGCKIGVRPLEHIMATLKSMGAEIVRDGNELWIKAPLGLRGAVFDLYAVSPNEHSGRTKTALLAGALAQGETKIIHPFRAQEIDDLCKFLIYNDVSITVEKEAITVVGQPMLTGASYTMPSDFLEFVTLACAIQSAGGHLIAMPIPPLIHFSDEVRLLKSCGFDIEIGSDSISVIPGSLHAMEFSCPPIYSDLQPILSASLCGAEGTSIIHDNVWPDRFDHLKGLHQLGARIDRRGNTVYVTGPSSLRGTTLQANDLRSAASLLIAALGATGKSTLYGIEHLNRGYPDLSGKLRALGAAIEEGKQ